MLKGVVVSSRKSSLAPGKGLLRGIGLSGDALDEIDDEDQEEGEGEVTLKGKGRTTAMWRAVGMSTWRDRFDSQDYRDMYYTVGADKESLRIYMKPKVKASYEDDYLDPDTDDNNSSNKEGGVSTERKKSEGKENLEGGGSVDIFFIRGHSRLRDKIASFSFICVDVVACLNAQKDELIDMEVDERTWSFAPVKEGCDDVFLLDIS
jgi:hypothetical protein